MNRVIHSNPHPRAGQTVSVTSGRFAGMEYQIEDWWDRVSGISWMNADGNPACLEYAITFRGPIDDEVLYGKIGRLGKLVHVTELAPC